MSVISPSQAQREHRCQGLSLQAVNNTTIATYGTCSLTLDLGLRLTFRQIFIIANIGTPILGVDFLNRNGLLVNMQRQHLIDPVTQLKVQGITCIDASSPSPSLLPKKPVSDYLTILLEFPSITRPYSGDLQIKHDVTHHIETTGSPVHART